MVLTLIFKLALLLLFAFLFYYASVSMSASADYEMGPEQWPQLILLLLIVSLLFGIYHEYRQLKKAGYRVDMQKFRGQVQWFLRSKLILGMGTLLLMGVLMEPIGFLPTSFLFLFLYGLVFGERRVWLISLVALGITLVLYLGFSVLLGVRLPRGTILVFRNFAMWLESLMSLF